MSNKNHLECVTDIIINKIWAAREIIAMGTRENTSQQVAGILKIATNEMDELITWSQKIRTLQKGHTNTEQKEV